MSSENGGLENLEGSIPELIESICTLLTGIDDPQEAME